MPPSPFLFTDCGCRRAWYLAASDAAFEALRGDIGGKAGPAAVVAYEGPVGATQSRSRELVGLSGCRFIAPIPPSIF